MKTDQCHKIIQWESYKNHIDHLIKNSKELSKEILPQMNVMVRYNQQSLQEDDQILEDDLEDDLEDGIDDGMLNFLLPKSIIQDVSMIINHECWIGHTNFDITEEIAEHLNVAEGVELLKIIGRYQFVIGIGKCFSFKEVRSNIYKILEIKTSEKNK
jgi:hypothetical protein